MKKVLFYIFLIMIVFLAAGAAGINTYITHSQENRIISAEEAKMIKNTDCIVVLGCRVKPNGQPSMMLNDRLSKGVELYEKKAAPKMIMSGDHGQKEYDEVNAMKEYAIEAGVPSSDVFMDHAGFSTYESVYRSKDVFEADKIIIVSQKYHLYRALYIAEQLGIEAYGVSADYREYGGQTNREIREILARCKDFIKTKLKPEPTYLGEAIPVSGDGDVTND